jgi:hypothetical protein
MANGKWQKAKPNAEDAEDAEGEQTEELSTAVQRRYSQI